MNTETRRRQMREELMARAARIIEADRKRRLETIKRVIESTRSIKGPYSPEKCRAQLRDLFGGKRREAVIDQ